MNARQRGCGAFLGGLGGGPSALVLEGEAGIGKTALFEAGLALSAGSSVLRARCVQAESQLGYAGLADLLDRMAEPVLEGLASPQPCVGREYMALPDPTAVAAGHEPPMEPAEASSPPMPVRIELRDYDPSWPRLYAREAARIRSALAERVVRLEHAGSTAVPGLAAKAIIDIVLEVPDAAEEAAYLPALEAAGYVVRLREPDWFQHRLFKGPDTDINLHLFSAGCPETDRMVLFRDWFRSNNRDRELYEGVKRELAERSWSSVQRYAEAKTPVIGAILARAQGTDGPPP